MERTPRAICTGIKVNVLNARAKKYKRTDEKGFEKSERL